MPRLVRAGAAAAALAAGTIGAAEQPPVGVADYERERKWANEIVPRVVVGEAVDLEAPGGRRFLGLYTRAAGARAALVVVHGLGVHPDWGLIGVLRADLADAGYSTLAAQMPVLPPDAPGAEYAPTFPEAAERLGAAVGFLRARGYPAVAIVSHSMGSRMTDAYLARARGSPVVAWASVGLSGAFASAERLSFPVLDLVGEHDLPQVRQGVLARAAAMRGAPAYTPAVAPGADHFFSGRQPELVRRIREFLDRVLR
jgi:pimeloyl-ACP methyl ester carboxylesterase